MPQRMRQWHGTTYGNPSHLASINDWAVACATAQVSIKACSKIVCGGGCASGFSAADDLGTNQPPMPLLIAFKQLFLPDTIKSFTATVQASSLKLACKESARTAAVVSKEHLACCNNKSWGAKSTLAGMKASKPICKCNMTHISC